MPIFIQRCAPDLSFAEPAAFITYCSYPFAGVQEVLLQPHPVKRLKRSKGISIHTPLVDVACGHWATYAVDEAGHVWAWGLNNYGQLAMPGQVRPNCATLRSVHTWQ